MSHPSIRQSAKDQLEMMWRTAIKSPKKNVKGAMIIQQVMMTMIECAMCRTFVQEGNIRIRSSEYQQILYMFDDLVDTLL
jgi:Pyruvate/2-oxoacid:ferredoxin oxidoreductase delta subunit